MCGKTFLNLILKKSMFKLFKVHFPVSFDNFYLHITVCICISDNGHALLDLKNYHMTWSTFCKKYAKKIKQSFRKT